MTQKIICITLMIIAMVFTVLPGAFGFQDVLETPAIKSALAPKTLLNAVTRAGTRLVAVGWRGHILYSDDQGKSWTQASVPLSSDLTDVCFPSPKQGWATGQDGVVLHSTDGGATWIKQLDGFAAVKIMEKYYAAHPAKDSEANERLQGNVKQLVQEGGDKPFLSVWFDSEQSGFIVGTFNLIFRTKDGGRSWEPYFDRTENPRFLHLNAVRRIGQDWFIAGEQGTAMKYDAKADRFRKLETGYMGSFFGITGAPGKVMMFGLRGNAYLTRDGGATWKKAETTVDAGLTGGVMTEDGRIVLVNQAGIILISADGINFKRIKVDRPFPAAAVAVTGKDEIVLAGLIGLKVQSLK